MVVSILLIASHARRTLVILEVITILLRAAVAWLVTLGKMEVHAMVSKKSSYYSITLTLLYIIWVACSKGTFKPTSGNGACQDCPPTMSSEVGSVICSCASGYERSEAQCRGNSYCLAMTYIVNIAL